MGFDISKPAKTITMSADTDAVNTLENKNNVVPIEGTIENPGSSFVYPVKANSLNIIRIPTISVNVVEPPRYDHEPYMTGYEDGTFRPDNNITRAETAAIISRLGNYDENHNYADILPFRYSDVNEKDWFANYVYYAYRGGELMTGYLGGIFKPENAVTRAEFAFMLCRRMTLMEEGKTPPFDDLKNHWAGEYITNLIEKDIVHGYSDGTFRPDTPVTRAEAVVMVNNAFGRTIQTADWLPNPPFKDISTSHWAYKDIVEATVMHSKAQCGAK